MAAHADSIPFLSSHAFRSRLFDIIGPNYEAINHPNAVIHVSTYNLQNKCFVRSFATGMRAEFYRNNSPEKGQILYTTAGQNITYKYQDASGQIQEKTAAKNPIGLAARPTPEDYEQVLLTQVQKVEPRFQPIPLSNNPFGTNESVQAYEARKRAQIDQIMSAIDAGDEIINLQEIDFLKMNGSKEPGLDGVKQRLQNHFFYLLQEKGYQWIISEDGVNQQPLAVIYNAKKFQHLNTQGVFQYTGNEGPPLFRGMETIFQPIDQSGPVQFIVNTNLHLQYDHDYQCEIEAYQSQFEHQQGVMHIMTGDCGNCQNLPTALGSKEECTSLGKDLQRRNTVSQGVAFVVAPEGYRVRSVVNADRSHQFIQLESSIQCVQSNDTQPSCTEVGLRYSVAQPIPTSGLPQSHSQSHADSELEDFEDLGGSSNPQLHGQDDNSVAIANGNKPRGQVFFIRAVSPPFTLTTDIYKNLLASPTGTYSNFELIDVNGNTIQGGNRNISNTVFVYPGNEEQALRDLSQKNPNSWQFNDTTAPQRGAKLAVIAQGLTHGQNGRAFPLPTTFYTVDTFGVNPAGLARRAELAAHQMQSFNALLDQGHNVAIYVKPDKGIAFGPQQFVSKQGDTPYYLAFWGGVKTRLEPMDHQLAAIYAAGVRNAAANQQKQHKPIEYASLWEYLSGREGSLNPFSWFGKFSETEKVAAAAKFIVAIIHYNCHGSMQGFQGDHLTEKEFKALSDGDLEKAVQQVRFQEGDPIYNAILDAIKPQSGFSLTC